MEPEKRQSYFMNRFLPLIGLCAFIIFGAILLFQMLAIPEASFVEFKSGEGEMRMDRNSGKLIIRQSTRNAIIDVNDSDIADALYRGGIEIVCEHPDSRTLVRISTGKPSRIFGEKRGIKSNGEVFIVNPSGIIVGADGVIDVENTLDTVSTLDGIKPGNYTTEANSAELKAHGNVYALAIRKAGVIRAALLPGKVKPIQPDSKNEPAPVISDSAN